MEETRRTQTPAEISGWGHSSPSRGKQRYDRPPGASNGSDRPQFKRQDRPRPPKAWSHQTLLKGLVGKSLSITLMSGEVIKGSLLELDQYTLLVGTSGVGSSLTAGSHLIFKHDISSIAGVSQ